MTQIIEMVILPDGQTKIATHGFAGRACRDASKFVEEALGTRLLTGGKLDQRRRAADISSVTVSYGRGGFLSGKFLVGRSPAACDAYQATQQK